MEKIKYNLNKKEIINQKETLEKKTVSPDKEKQILFNHKSSLEALLYIIKNCQLQYLLQFNNINNKNQKIKTKQILISLKHHLNLILKEKNKKISYIKKQNEKSKKKLQNLLFPSSKDLKKIEYNIKFKYNKYTNNKVKYIIFEKNQLKLLNFQIKKEIEKTTFLIEQKNQINSFLKSYPYLSKTIQNIYCDNKYENISKVSDILKDVIMNVRKDFINTVKEKMAKESEIDEISVKIENFRDFMENNKLNGYKKYIETKDIIKEDSKECSETTIIANHSKRNSLFSNNNNKKNDNNQKERKIGSILQKNLSLCKNKISKDLFKDKFNNKINNYLNMNINVNININNNNYYLDKNKLDENNEESEAYEFELNEKNKIIITPIVSCENKNKYIQGNTSLITGSNKKDDNFTLDIKHE